MKRLYYFLRLVKHWLRRQPQPLRTVWVIELPKHLQSGCVYVVGEGEYLWYVAMLCPCNCGATLHMSLMPEGRPKWQLTEHRDGTITLDPSVWRTKDCKSHFFLRKGLIQWCSSSVP